MKMSRQDYQDLSHIMQAGTTNTAFGPVTVNCLKTLYKSEGLSMKRMRWQLMYHSLDNAVQGSTVPLSRG